MGRGHLLAPEISSKLRTCWLSNLHSEFEVLNYAAEVGCPKSTEVDEPRYPLQFMKVDNIKFHLKIKMSCFQHDFCIASTGSI
jgi:hypothetical protein